MKPIYWKHVMGDHGCYWHLWKVGEVLVGLPGHYFPEGFIGPVNAYHPEQPTVVLNCYLPDNYWDDLFVAQPPSQVIPEPPKCEDREYRLALIGGRVEPGVAVTQMLPDTGVIPEPCDFRPPPWKCYDCGNTEDFKTIHHEAGDFDVECQKCLSLDTGEDDGRDR